jgi:uncharacterized protein YdiU (UPF0061 family)
MLKLAEAWHPLLPMSKSKELVNRTYDGHYQRQYMRLMRNKLGLRTEDAGYYFYCIFLQMQVRGFEAV